MLLTGKEQNQEHLLLGKPFLINLIFARPKRAKFFTWSQFFSLRIYKVLILNKARPLDAPVNNWSNQLVLIPQSTSHF